MSAAAAPPSPASPSPASVSPAGAVQNVQVAVRLRPTGEGAAAHAWRALPGAAQVQQFDEAEKPVPKQLYAFGAWH